MQIRAKLYCDTHGDGELHFIDKGVGEIYKPEIRGDKRTRDIIKPHITLRMGKYRLQLNQEDFIKFARQVVFDKSGEANELVLRESLRDVHSGHG
jgi:hypothetical protein